MIKSDNYDSRVAATINFEKPVNVNGAATSDSVKTDVIDSKNDTKVVFNKPAAVDQIQPKLANILVVGLPTADPHVLNALWNDLGTLKISLG